MTDLVLVVTGVGGMGLAVARRLGSGRRVILADYSEKALDAAVSQLQSEGFIVESHKVDVADYDSVRQLSEHAAKAGRIDAIVHTAGVAPATGSKEQILDVDLVGTVNIIDAFLPVVSPGSSLVCIASSAGHMYKFSENLEQHLATAPREKIVDHPDITSTTRVSAYSLAKRGNTLRVQRAALAYGLKGARINTISPGVTHTPLAQAELAGDLGDSVRSLVAAAAFQRLGTTFEIAAAAAFLCSSDASFVTGTDLLVDGGVIAGKVWGPKAGK
ncbi:hypothetical protein CLAIMM_14547 [Cladophialophora immunda]|nr:hypothetical protein CLAIMM_14547 [Cladophialophora immunda]